MTTSVTVTPAGHRIKVTTTLITDDGRVPTEHILEAGSAPRTFHAHSTMEVHVEEIQVEKSEPLAAIGTPERVEQDLKNYRDGKPTR